LTLTNGTLFITAAPLKITSLEVSNGVAVITWNSVSGQTYRLQYKDSVTDANWNDVAQAVQATGPTASATNLVGSVPHRFYRVMVVETPAASPPVITSITVTGGSAVIAWSATPGQNYRLQHKQDVTSENWIDLNPDVLATGPVATATNFVGNAPRRFYRVLFVPQP